MQEIKVFCGSTVHRLPDVTRGQVASKLVIHSISLSPNQSAWKTLMNLGITNYSNMHTMNAYGEVGVQLHSFLTSAQDGGG
jgi:hypothetical protein